MDKLTKKQLKILETQRNITELYLGTFQVGDERSMATRELMEYLEPFMEEEDDEEDPEEEEGG